MALIHQGTSTTLVSIDTADIPNGDTANIYIDSRTRTFTFDSASTEATKIIRPGPFYLRPHDYSAGGVWVETIGNDIDVFNAGQNIGDILQSTNWGASTGSRYNLNDGTIQLGGSAAPKFSVTAAGLITSIAGSIGGFTINGTSGLYAGAGATRVQMQPGVGIWTGATAQASALNYLDVDGSGWLADGNISWTAAGVLTQTLTDGGNLTLDGGADIYLSDAATPGKLIFEGSGADIEVYRASGYGITDSLLIDGNVRIANVADVTDYLQIRHNGTDVIFTNITNGGTLGESLKLGQGAVDFEDLWVYIGGNVGIGTASPSAYADLTLEGGALCIKERATPTANTNYGKIYTKTDNLLYFQDGGGTEHALAFA